MVIVPRLLAHAKYVQEADVMAFTMGEELDRHESLNVRRGSGRMTRAFGHVGVTKYQTMCKGWLIVLVTTR